MCVYLHSNRLDFDDLLVDTCCLCHLSKASNEVRICNAFMRKLLLHTSIDIFCIVLRSTCLAMGPYQSAANQWTCYSLTGRFRTLFWVSVVLRETCTIAMYAFRDQVYILVTACDFHSSCFSLWLVALPNSRRYELFLLARFLSLWVLWRHDDFGDHLTQSRDMWKTNLEFLTWKIGW